MATSLGKKMKCEPYFSLVPMQDGSTIRVPGSVVSHIELTRDPLTPAHPIADAHAVRVIERMKEREAWFTARITQLEAHCNKVATELAEMKRKHPEPAVSPRLSLNPSRTRNPL